MVFDAVASRFLVAAKAIHGFRRSCPLHTIRGRYGANVALSLRGHSLSSLGPSGDGRGTCIATVPRRRAFVPLLL